MFFSLSCFILPLAALLSLVLAARCPNGTTEGAAHLCFPDTSAGCPPGTFTTTGFIGRGSPVPNVCRLCESGFTTIGFGVRICRRVGFPCPRDHRQNSLGDCIRCLQGTKYDIPTERCVDCPPGTGSVAGLSLNCAPCSLLISAGVTDTRCPMFRIVPLDSTRTCPSGTMVQSRDSINRPICEQCTPGTFSVGPNANECSSCAAGLVSTQIGASECSSCPAGFKAIESGKFCERVSDGCALGTKDMDTRGTQLCASETCGNGDNSVQAVEERFCGPCSSKTFTQQFQNSEERCEECRIDQLSDGNVCAMCGNGEVRDDTSCGCRGPLAVGRGRVNGVCTRCAPGSFGEAGADGDHVCTKCAAGSVYFSVSDSQTVGCLNAIRCTSLTSLCRPCNSGFVSREAGSLECEACPEGTFTYGGEAKCLMAGETSIAVPFSDAFGRVIPSGWR